MIITDPLQKPSQRFLQVIQAYFEHQGFTFQKNKKSFERHFEKGKQSVYFEFRISTLTTVNVRWHISFEKLEKLYAELIGTPKQFKSFWTVGTDMSHHTRWLNHIHMPPSLYNNATLQYDDFSINQASNTIINFYESFIVPYFENYKNYESIEKYYNEEIKAIGIKGLILAKYISRSDYRKLVEIYRNQVNARTGKKGDQDRLVLERTLELLDIKNLKDILD